MEYFYIFKNIDYEFIFMAFFKFVFFFCVILYCRLLFLQQLLQFETFENKKISNKFIFLILSFLYTSLSLLILPLFVLLVNSFEEPDFTSANYAFISSLIIISYCFIKTFLYTYLEDGIPESLFNEIINEHKKKLNKKPNG